MISGTREPACGHATAPRVLVVAMMVLGTGQFLFAQEEGTIDNYVKELQSEQVQVRNKAVDAILQDQNLIVDKLIALVDPANPKKQSYETRAAAAFVLGELRAVRAVPILAKVLPEEAMELTSRISRFDSPFWTALVKIGRPAVPAMINNIESSDAPILRTKSMDVLNHVLGGKRRVLELLGKLKVRAAGDEQKSLRIKKAEEWAGAHYKETEEPLY